MTAADQDFINQSRMLGFVHSPKVFLDLGVCKGSLQTQKCQAVIFNLCFQGAIANQFCPCEEPESVVEGLHSVKGPGTWSKVDCWLQRRIGNKRWSLPMEKTIVL